MMPEQLAFTIEVFLNGLMAGVLLARQGVDVVVLEKHTDFLRDFRGDTLHPSTLEVMASVFS